MPFWSGETYRAIARCLASGQMIRGVDVEGLRSALIEHFGVEDILLCGSASLALELALRTCHLQTGDEVIVPSFCCSAIVAPILAVGATSVLADVSTELNLTVETVDAACTSHTRAIIVPHLFGNPADIDAIAELGNAKNIVVIDDAAQALGATTADGQSLGTSGDMGVVSFGAEKVCFGLGGGALISHSRGVLDGARETALGYPSIIHALRQLTAMFAYRRWRRWTLPVQRLIARGPEKNPHAPPQPYRQDNLTNVQAAVARTLMDSLPENLQARRARVQAYGQLLGDQAGLELIPHRPSSACLTQVVRVLSKRRSEDGAARVIQALGAAGCEVQGSYMPIHLLGSFSACVWDRLPYTERVWADLVEVPCEPTVSLADVERIASIVRSCAGN